MRRASACTDRASLTDPDALPFKPATSPNGGYFGELGP
jgi:hypothetical protein